MADMTDESRNLEAHQKERDVLFFNEAFVIGVLQAVSGGSLFAALAQTEALLKLSGKFSFLAFLTLMGAALISAVLAAYWKHQYKMWDVKSRVSASEQEVYEAETRASSARTYLGAMRRAMFVAVLAIVFALVELLLAAWVLA